MTLQIIRLFFSILSFLSPKQASRLAMMLFQRPRIKKTRPRELDLYNTFDERRISYEPEDLYVYEKGPSDAHRILLVHGWESGPGSLYAIAIALVNKGFRVLVMGLPAHGKSRLRKTNMISASHSIRHLMEQERLEKNFSIITHSFGSGATVLALRNTDRRPDHLIFLTSPDRMCAIFSDFGRQIHIGKKAYDLLIRRTEQFTPVKMKDFNISEFIGQINFGRLLLMHDREDKVLPWDNAEAIHAKNPETQLIALQNKGHYRMLWDQEVIDHITYELEIPIDVH